MLLDDRFLDCPDLPQYGERLAVCNADLPSSAGPWIKIVLLMICLTAISSAVGFAEANMQGNLPLQASVVGAVVLGCVCLWFGIGSLGFDRRKHALFVFEGGIHVNEGVRYLVSYGNWLEFCWGTRRVSIPLRLLKGFHIRSHEQGDQTHQRANFQLPDGRTMTIDTADGLEADAALRALQTRLEA